MTGKDASKPLPPKEAARFVDEDEDIKVIPPKSIKKPPPKG